MPSLFSLVQIAPVSERPIILFVAAARMWGRKGLHTARWLTIHTVIQCHRMALSEKDLDEFIEIYESVEGERLDRGEARQVATNLIEVYRLIFLTPPTHSSQAPREALSSEPAPDHRPPCS